VSARGPVPPPRGQAPRTAPDDARAIVREFLSDAEEQAWYGLLETHDALLRALDSRLLAEHGMPLSVFEALMHIAHAETGTISVSDLADRARLSPSQTSRVAIGLEREGLAKRRRSPDDSRSTVVAITEAGRARLRDVAPTYLSTIRTHLFDALTDRDVAQLVRIWDRANTSRPPSARNRHPPPPR
jgi:DNA-binding MarR family transcriptional regulator